MKKVTVYVVRVISLVTGKMIESVETSLRACIALTYGLQCGWTIHTRGESGDLVASDSWADRKFKHNVRAFRQSLSPTFIDVRQQAIWANAIV